MNAVERIYKAMSHDSFGKTLAKMSTEELEGFIGNNLKVCAPWEEFNPMGVYIFLNIDENEQAMSCGYLGTPAKSVYEAAINDRWTQVYFLSERLPSLEDLEVGSIFTYVPEHEDRAAMVGIKVGSDHWGVSGDDVMMNSKTLEIYLDYSEGELKFYLDGTEIDVEVKK